MWKPVKNYNSLYEVNEEGEIRSLYYWNGHEYKKRKKPYILKQSNTTTGYKKVELANRQIIKKEHITFKRLQNYYRMYGLKNQLNKYNIDLEQLKNDFKKGMTNKELAEKYNCSSAIIATRRHQLKKGEI